MMERTYPMTLEGKKLLEAELDELKQTKRREVVERLKLAQSFGDITENAEYEAAKGEQAFVEGRIASLEHMLRYAELIEDSAVPEGVAALGRLVSFRELPDGEEETYAIVGSVEADPLEGKISQDSPIAQAVLGHREGEEVEIRIPAGKIRVRLTRVESLSTASSC